MPTSDRKLAARLSEGDPGALDEFFRDQVPVLFRFARRRLGATPDLVEEIVQETLVKIIDKIDGFRGDSALSTWMCSVCFRVIQDHQARTRRRLETPIVGEELDFRAADAGLGAAPLDPEADLLQGEAADRVHEVLDRLPTPYGDVLEWKYIEEQPVKEIALRLGVSPKAAESTLVRARSAFRKTFEGSGGADE